ncbi:hypothetical protein BDZ94DRAFT_1139093, partial [Collybia nuda]
EKHVRFSRKHTFYSPPTPPTPELSLGSVSPASSGGPITPPSYSGNLPGPTPGSVCVHPLLQLSRSPAVNFDLTQPPSTITSRHHGISQRVLSEPATSPPMRTMTITSRHLPWIITAHTSRGPFVTVYDVFDAIYYTLRKNITPNEYHSLPTQKDKHHVNTAYEQRYRRIRSSREYQDEKSGGVRRVDFLMDHTRFMGLSMTRETDTWIL